MKTLVIVANESRISPLRVQALQAGVNAKIVCPTSNWALLRGCRFDTVLMEPDVTLTQEQRDQLAVVQAFGREPKSVSELVAELAREVTALRAEVSELRDLARGGR